jgi:predicted Zn-dependent peptidase
MRDPLLNALFEPDFEHSFANGITLVGKSMPVTEVVAVDVWIPTGSRHEQPGEYGISHFLEHMIFKGTPTLAPGEFDRLIEGRGGITNAATSQDYTHYYIAVAQSDLEEVLPVFAELILGAGIPEGELERERLVVLEEMRRAADNPDHCTYHTLMEHLFPEHPYSRPVLGSMDSVAALTAAQLRAYHRRHYCPSRMVVAVAGGMDPEAMIATVEKSFACFGDAEPQPGSGVAGASSGEDLWDGPRLLRVEREHPRAEMTRLCLAWPTVAVHQWQDGTYCELLAVILGSGRVSRLVQRLREDYGWVRGIGCHHHSQDLAGYFSISAHLHPQDLGRVEQVIRQEIAAVQQEGVTPAELARAKRSLQRELLFSSESPAQMASLFGYYCLMGSRTGLGLAWQCLHTATLEDIRRVANQYLPLDGYTLVTLSPAGVEAARIPD